MNEVILHSRAAEIYLRRRFSWESEEVWILGLSSAKVLVGERMLFRGTVDRCVFHPRDAFRFCCQVNASSFLLAHNHPTGEARPSAHDNDVTRRLRKLSLQMEIPLIDHLILSQSEYYSYADAGVFTSHHYLHRALK